MGCREKMDSAQVLNRNINNNRIRQELVEVVEGGAHWAPRGFSPAIAAIFAEQNRSLYVDGLMHEDISL